MASTDHSSPGLLNKQRQLVVDLVLIPTLTKHMQMGWDPSGCISSVSRISFKQVLTTRNRPEKRQVDYRQYRGREKKGKACGSRREEETETHAKSQTQTSLKSRIFQSPIGADVTKK